VIHKRTGAVHEFPEIHDWTGTILHSLASPCSCTVPCVLPRPFFAFLAVLSRVRRDDRVGIEAWNVTQISSMKLGRCEARVVKTRFVQLVSE
jgi:hypothetical protein